MNLVQKENRRLGFYFIETFSLKLKEVLIIAVSLLATKHVMLIHKCNTKITNEFQIFSHKLIKTTNSKTTKLPTYIRLNSFITARGGESLTLPGTPNKHQTPNTNIHQLITNIL